MNSLLFQIDFGLNGRGRLFQKGHWSQPERNGTWALGPRASLCLPRPDYDGDVGVLFELTPALHPPTTLSRSLKIVINKEYHFECRLFRADALLIKVISVASCATELQIDFESEDRPGIVGDDRPLTFAIHRVSLIALNNSSFSAATRRTQLHSIGHLKETIAVAELALGQVVSTVMASFESLGNTCDFGDLQRSLGADLLGLLRFGGVDIRDLVRGLLDKFSNLSDVETRDICVSIVANNYFVVERHYGIGWHTLMKPSEASPEQIAAREAWRLPLLRRKFIETIEDAQKTFVLRRPEGLLREQVDAVVESLRLLSDCTVLWVEQGESNVGEVELLSSYLLKGYLDVSDGMGSSSQEAWVNTCANAYLVRKHLEISCDNADPPQL